MFHKHQNFTVFLVFFIGGCAPMSASPQTEQMKTIEPIIPLSSLYTPDTGYKPGVNRDEPVWVLKAPPQVASVLKKKYPDLKKLPKQTSYRLGQMYLGSESFCATYDLAQKYVRKEIAGANADTLVADTGDDCENRFTYYKPMKVVFSGITKIVECLEYRELPGTWIYPFTVYLFTKAPVR